MTETPKQPKRAELRYCEHCGRDTEQDRAQVDKSVEFPWRCRICGKPTQGEPPHYAARVT